MPLGNSWENNSLILLTTHTFASFPDSTVGGLQGVQSPAKGQTAHLLAGILSTATIDQYYIITHLQKTAPI